MIEHTTTDVNDMVSSLMGDNNTVQERDPDKLYSNDIMTQMMSTMVNGATSNDLKKFKEYIEGDGKGIRDYVTDIKYSYSTTLNIYTADGYQVCPSTVFTALMSEMGGGQAYSGMQGDMMTTNMEVWQELIDNDELLEKQYEVLAGRMPSDPHEAVVMVGENNEISDYTLYTLGLKDSAELSQMMKDAMAGKKLPEPEQSEYTYDQILGLKFKLLLNTDYYQKNENGTWTDMRDDELYLLSKLESAPEINIVGILRADSDSASNAASGTVGYLSSLMTELITDINDSEIVKAQKENPETDIFTGLPFSNGEKPTMEDLQAYVATLPAENQAQFGAYIQQMKSQGLTDEQIVDRFSSYIENTKSTATYEQNLSAMGVSDLSDPSRISIFPKDFESKETISSLIEDYNKKMDEDGQITYTDYIGLMLSSVTTIINAISYILIAFVSISLIVSSIMIGIITYISVLERTKEIGILRAMGASKSDVSHVFNAETLIVGFAAGAIGIGVTLLLLIPINAIIKAITDIGGLAVLPTGGAIILVLISMLLTFIAGLIPSKIAARRDPVTSLRSE